LLLAALGLAFYNDNLRPLARVGGVEVGPQLVRNRLGLENWRITQEGHRLTQANIDQEIDADTFATRQSELEQRRQALTTTGLDDLVDVIFQSQLATTEGITVSDADVDAAYNELFLGVERRHVFQVVVEPTAAEGEDASPTIAERRAALEKAQEALAAIQAGDAWADVAREFGTDDSAANGGDLGNVSELAITDTNFGAELFKLDQGGTTGIIRGNDGVYRIGRVTEIVTATEQPGLREDLIKDIPEAGVREQLRFEIGSQRLKDKIISAAIAETPEQVRIAIIQVDGAFSEDPAEAEGEVKYAEIVYAPNNDLEVAPDLPENDAAWETARAEAQAAFDELNALTQGEVRAEAFKQKASDVSDSPTGEDGGEVDFTTRGLLPDAVGNALFDSEHQSGELIGPVRGDAAYYVLLFEEKRESPESRVQEIKDLLAQPGADFAQIAKDKSDGAEAADGGEVGWVTRDQLAEDLREPVFSLAVGGVTDALELGDAHYFIKAEEKATRPLDPDQLPDIRGSAFDEWYQPKKDQAKKDDVIVIAGEEEEPEGTLEPGED
jgi:parvulin-like peptidyl-prolyl isomerase